MGNFSIWSIIGIIGTTLISMWGIVKYIICQNYRLDDNLSKSIVGVIKNKSKWKFELTSDFSLNKKYPQIYQSISKTNGVYMFFSRNERLLTAGWQGKDTISEIYFFRWQKNKIEKFIIENSTLKENINVMILQPHGVDKLGELNNKPEIFLDEHLYIDIEQDIEDMLKYGKDKTGCLLYGKPGTGKTRLVKYFSQKFELPIYTIFLNPEYTNLDILIMFSSIPKKCIVLLEDFDNYFNKRECILKNDNVKFTFDSIINSLDGVYNDFKQVVFVMTANDISKIDDSIKHRSSRFKFVREITPPSYIKRMEILNNESLAKMTDGMSLDKIFFVNSIKDKYTEDEIMTKININV